MGSLGQERELQQLMEMEPHTQQVTADSEPSDRRLVVIAYIAKPPITAALQQGPSGGIAS